MAQLVARQFWELDAAGSSPVIPTNKKGTLLGAFFIALKFEKDLNLKKARTVKK